MRTFRLYCFVGLLATVGCRCGPNETPTRQLNPEFLAEPAELTFNACPVVDGSGNAIPDVFPDRKAFTLKNNATVSGPVSVSFIGADKEAWQVDVEGMDAGINCLETTCLGIAPDGTLDPLQGSTERVIGLAFSPRKTDPSAGELTIDDGSDATDPIKVKLSGTTIAKPVKPKLKLSYETFAGSGVYKDCQLKESLSDPALSCQLEWNNLPDGGYQPTFFDESRDLRVKLENLGCPTLKVSRLELFAPLSASELAFSLTNPAVPPSPVAPLSLNAVQAQGESVITIRFRPSRTLDQSTTRIAFLRVSSNDPANPETSTNDGITIQLNGEASEPSLFATPVFCDFNLASDNCGNAGGKLADKAFVRLSNQDPLVPLTVEAMEFDPASLGRFSVTDGGVPVTIAGNGSRTIEITHTPGALFVAGLLNIRAGAAGNANVQLFAGQQPELYTRQESRPTGITAELDFGDPPTATSTQVLLVGNRADAGTLLVNRITVDQPSPFAITTNLAPGTQIPPGQTRSVTVQYQKPVSGGTQYGTLRIQSNANYAAPEYFPVTLLADSPPDFRPTAVLRGPDGGTGSINWSLVSGITALPINGRTSYDDLLDGGRKPVKDYRFRLVSVQPAIEDGGVSLTQNGVRTDAGSQLLQIHPSIPATYRIILQVWDDGDQQSSNTDNLFIKTEF